MRNLKQVLESLIISYDRNEKINFIDVRDLDTNLKNRELFESFVNAYDNNKIPNFSDLNELERIVTTK